METQPTSVDMQKKNTALLSFMADKWFRVLECSLILSTLFYFKEKTNNILISIIYWISWGVFCMLFMQIGDYVSELIISKRNYNKNRQFIIWMLSMFFVFMFYYLITGVTTSVMSAK